MIGESLGDCLFMIEYQDKSLVYCDINFTDNSMFLVWDYAYNDIFKEYINKKS